MTLLYRHMQRVISSGSAAAREKMIEEVVNIYREYAKFPVLASASLSKASSSSGQSKLTVVQSEWTQRDIERLEKVKFARSHILQRASSESKDTFQILTTTQPQEVNAELWNKQSPSGRLRAVVRKVTVKKEEKQFVEIWCDNHKVKNVDVQALQKHGKIYEQDGQFGCFEWSSSEGHLLYVAERKLTKTASYFDNKPNNNHTDDAEELAKSTEEVAKGDEHVFREDWGELLVSKHHPVLCVLDIETGEVSILENVPGDISPGQAVWAPDDAGVVFVGWWHEPWRLGLIYCPIRRSAIFHIDLQSASCTVLGADDQSSRSPVFSPDQSKLVYLQNPVGGPHQRCCKLMMYDWSSKETSCVVDVVSSPESEDSFPGLYAQTLPRPCWSADSQRLVFHSSWRSRHELILVDTQSKQLTRLTKDAKVLHWAVADMKDDVILAACATPNTPHFLMLGILPPAGEEGSISWQSLDGDHAVLSEIKWEVLKHTPTPDRVNPKYSSMDYESILLIPDQSESQEEKPPLVVYPHGGPHSVFSGDFLLYAAGLCRCGFAVLLVNYRGSTGFGQDSIDSLLGNIGDQDVKDCQAAALDVVESGRVHKEKLLVIGGSHGGFLTAHLIGQYPDFYKAACLRNPVINIATMVGTTDIPDWCYTESGDQDWNFSRICTKSLDDMWKHSPIQYVDQVKTPAMIMIGAGDLRVPPKQGHEFNRALKARGVPTRMMVYPDNSHPINKVEAEADAFVNIVHWFTKHL